MSEIIEVAFKGNRKEFFLWESGDVPPLHTAVIVEADRGEDMGRVHSTGDLALKRTRGTAHGTGDVPPTRRARRLATPDDVRRHDEVRAQDEDARRKAAERVRANALVMKLSDAEWQWDRKKLTFYFTAEKRVDFRTLVRELAAMFRTRIELKQIGVRDEAKRLDGIGRCGRQYCSASWLPELRPVSLGVAKDQRLSLNPTQISGACGRLMCSLRYEHEFYVQARKRFPKEGKVVRTIAGEERVVSNDIFRERVVLRNTEAEIRTIPLSQFMSETGGGGSIAVATPAEIDEGDFDQEQDAVDSAALVIAADPEDEGVLPEEQVAHPSTPSAPSAPSVVPPIAAESESTGRRPHRRRGRRGGRRKRGGRKDTDNRGGSNGGNRGNGGGGRSGGGSA